MKFIKTKKLTKVYDYGQLVAIVEHTPEKVLQYISLLPSYRHQGNGRKILDYLKLQAPERLTHPMLRYYYDKTDELCNVRKWSQHMMLKLADSTSDESWLEEYT